jgi:hypothetical protein
VTEHEVPADFIFPILAQQFRSRRLAALWPEARIGAYEGARLVLCLFAEKSETKACS